MHRLFVALRPPPAIRAALLSVMNGVRGARWQDDGQFHVTVRYIGEVATPLAEEIALALGTIDHPVIAASIAGVGAFDRKGHVDALWAGIAPAPPLAALHRKVDHALVRLGLAPERRAYLPHVTLARLSRGVGDPLEIARWQADHAALSGASFDFTHLYLFESRLGGEGARYEAVQRWQLTPS